MPESRVDLLVAEGKVVDLVPSGSVPAEAALVAEAEGLTLLPGLIDVHTHLREPGFEYKEDVASGLAAAAQGGFSSIMCMANTRPVNDNATVTRLMLQRAAEAHPHGPRLFPVAALTVGLAGEQLAPLGELARAGCAAASNDGLPVRNTELFRRAMEYAATVDLPVIDHCEDPYLAPGAGMNEGRTSALLGLRGQPAAAEAIQVARDILLADELEIPIHLAHVSCRESVELIAWGKARGIPVTAETCPHYLFLTEEACEGYNTLAKVNPPLRTRDDVVALRQALRSGVVDILSTDHAPHAEHEKEVPFSDAPCGITGLDTALAWTWRLVREGVLGAEEFMRAWTAGPGRIFRLPANTFAPGDPADFLLFDPDEAWEVAPEALRSKSKNTPLLGSTLHGRVKAHFIAGRRIV
ncbi:MAG: dihydroorotase [Thermodesulfobacteriota bacterium]